MHISNDGSHVSLFDLLDYVAPEGMGEGQRELGRKAKALFQENARWHSEEFSMSVKDGCVIFSFFSCMREPGDPDCLRVIIPKDRTKPVRVESERDAVEAVIIERKVTVSP